MTNHLTPHVAFYLFHNASCVILVLDLRYDEGSGTDFKLLIATFSAHIGHFVSSPSNKLENDKHINANQWTGFYMIRTSIMKELKLET